MGVAFCFSMPKKQRELSTLVNLTKFNYFAGEMVEGEVILETNKPIRLRFGRVRLVGMESIFRIGRRFHTTDPIRSKKFINFKTNLECNNLHEPEGRTSIRFEFMIPLHLPPSICCSGYASITYTIHAEMYYGTGLSTQMTTNSQKIFLHSPVTEEIPPAFIDKYSWGAIHKQKIWLKCVQSRGVYQTGESCRVLVSLVNDAFSTITRFLVGIQQTINSSPRKESRIVYHEDTDLKILSGERMEEKHIEFTIPPTPEKICASTLPRGAKRNNRRLGYVGVSYSLIFTCEFEQGKQWSTFVPIQINSPPFDEPHCLVSRTPVVVPMDHDHQPPYEIDLYKPESENSLP